MPEVRIRSSDVFYRKIGTGPAIVLLHGFPASGSLWHNIWNKLATSFTVITPDFPGSGYSPLTTCTSISDMAEMVKLIIDTEGFSHAVIAGHSMGGYVGFELAKLYPQKIAGLSLVHSSPFADDEEKIKIRRKSIELIRKGGKNVFITQMIPNLFSPGFKLSQPAIVDTQVADSLNMEAPGMINFYEAMIARSDNSGILDSARFPLQWIFGMNDTIVSYKKILPESRISGVNFVSFYDNCGHMSMLEAPEKLAADVSEFAGYCYQRVYE